MIIFNFRLLLNLLCNLPLSTRPRTGSGKTSTFRLLTDLSLEHRPKAAESIYV